MRRVPMGRDANYANLAPASTSWDNAGRMRDSRWETPSGLQRHLCLPKSLYRTKPAKTALPGEDDNYIYDKFSESRFPTRNTGELSFSSVRTAGYELVQQDLLPVAKQPAGSYKEAAASCSFAV
jgi:hypothetical protein